MGKTTIIPEYGILSGETIAGYTFQTDKGRYTLINGMVDLSEPFQYMDLYTGRIMTENVLGKNEI